MRQCWSWCLFITFLAACPSPESRRYRALLSREPAAQGDEQVLWGCEPTHTSLTEKGVHVVVATYDADPVQWLPWLWHLGLTDAHVFIYHRQTKQLPWPGITNITLPCGMKLHIEQLVPNRGREAAVYLHHLITHYDELPAAIWLVHDHGPASRHSMCGPFMRRTRAFYRGLVANAKQAAKLQQQQARTGQRDMQAVIAAEGVGAHVGRNTVGAGLATAAAAAGGGLDQEQEHHVTHGRAGTMLHDLFTPPETPQPLPQATAALAGHDAQVMSRVVQHLAAGAGVSERNQGPAVTPGAADSSPLLGGLRKAEPTTKHDAVGLQHLQQGAAPHDGSRGTGMADPHADDPGKGQGGQAGTPHAGGRMHMRASQLLHRKRLAQCLEQHQPSPTADAAAQPGLPSGCPGLRQLYAKPTQRQGQGLHAYLTPSSADTATFARFARLGAVTLSSGCLERWARGCCSTFLCSNSSACPFQGVSCVSTQSNHRRWMHRSSLYDFRYENRVVGWAQGAPQDGQGLLGFDMTLIRYMSTAQDRSRKSWEPQHEYQTSFGERNLMAQQQGHAQQGQQLSQVQQLQQLQGTEQRHMQEHAGQPQPSHQDADAHKEGEESGAGGVHAAGGRPKLRSKTETEDRLRELLRLFGFEERTSNRNFKSCCASLVVRQEAVRLWPKELYQTLYDYATDPLNHYEATKAVATPAWRLWGGPRNMTEDDLFLYHEVDVALNMIKGCPGPNAQVVALLQQLQPLPRQTQET